MTVAEIVYGACRGCRSCRCDPDGRGRKGAGEPVVVDVPGVEHSTPLDAVEPDEVEGPVTWPS